MCVCVCVYVHVSLVLCLCAHFVCLCAYMQCVHEEYVFESNTTCSQYMENTQYLSMVNLQKVYQPQ